MVQCDPRLFLRTERLIEPDFMARGWKRSSPFFLEPGVPQGSLEWRGELHGFNYDQLLALADRLAAHGQPPAAASLILCSLLGESQEGKSRAYHHAAHYYDQFGALSGKISDWSGEPDHVAYRVGLRYEHGRKYAFWSRVKG